MDSEPLVSSQSVGAQKCLFTVYKLFHWPIDTSSFNQPALMWLSFLFTQLFREVRIMKFLDHPNIGKKFYLISSN